MWSIIIVLDVNIITQPYFIIAATYCYYTPKISNGVPILSSRRIEGSTAAIHCNEDFEIRGSQILTCDTDGVWRGNGRCGKFIRLRCSVVCGDTQ